MSSVMPEKTQQDETEAVSLTGLALLTHPRLNKGSAFSAEERREFGLIGLLPPHAATMEEQLARTYENYQRKPTDIERYIYLASLQDRNETLFFRLMQDHITEMMPIVYTPTVGAACQQYSHLYRRPHGLYIPYLEKDNLDAILNNTTIPNVKVIVVTDGERILGLGDLGVGGMGIPIGKLALYTLCAGIDPSTTLPIVLDVGTNTQSLINDPLYLGWKHERVRGQAYDDFIEAFVQAVMRKWPEVVLQWEDFSKGNARRLLDRYQDRLCTFNDDIQGTGAVTLAGLLAAMDAIGSKLSQQQIVMLGAGSAATGIADQLVVAMVDEGMSEADARHAIWLVDSQGLVHDGRTGLEDFKQRYAQPLGKTADWQVADRGMITMEDVVKNLHPGILIGTGAQPGAFHEALVRDLAQHVERPVIFPLSNPTSKSEAVPADLLEWTEGRALVATGSPFPPVYYEGTTFYIGQCNNSFIFPGVGLGVVASGARRVTESMFVAAARALSELSPARINPTASLYPALEGIRDVSRKVALAVALEAQRLGHADKLSREETVERINATVWEPEYKTYHRAR